MNSLYTNILDDLDEMDKFPETQSLPNLDHEEIENVNRSIRTIE